MNLYDGWLMVPKDAGKLPEVAHGQLQIDFGKSMTPGDFLVIRGRKPDGNPSVEYMQIGTLASGTTYNVTRDKAGLGATFNWPAETSYAVLGQAGDGRVEISSYNTPRISVITHGTAYNAQTETVRIGDINGMPGVTQQTWGIYIGTASQYLKWDGTTLTIAGNGSGVTNIDGGNITTGTIDAARITAVSLSAVKANVTSFSAINANMGAITAGSIVIGSTNKLWLNDSSDGTLAIGGATKASAPFRVTAAGALTATNATLTGSLDTGGARLDGTNGLRFIEGTATANKVLWVTNFTTNQELTAISVYLDAQDIVNTTTVTVRSPFGGYTSSIWMDASNTTADVTINASAAVTSQTIFKPEGTYFSDPIYVNNNAVWHAGNLVSPWTAGNDGAGSGLVADLLDGYHVSLLATVWAWCRMWRRTVCWRLADRSISTTRMPTLLTTLCGSKRAAPLLACRSTAIQCGTQGILHQAIMRFCRALRSQAA